MQTSDSAPLLRTQALTKQFPGGATALRDLTVDLPRGSIGLVGANGAGKTTLFRLMLGLIRPTAGSLEVCGMPVAADPVGVRARVGFMPEHDCLPLDQSAAAVVADFAELSGLPRRAARQRASAMLDLVGLDEARFRAVEGFSTGMRQRTKLAQALVADPEVVLLDEPTAGLDPIGREEMLALIRRLSGFGVSLVLATHLLDDVQQVCDHVVMLDAGSLVLAGETDALMQRTDTMRIDVGPLLDGTTVDDLVGALAARGLTATQAPPPADAGTLDVRATSAEDDPLDPLDPLDIVRDVVADLKLPLYSLSTRHTSLDEVYVRRAGTASTPGTAGSQPQR